MDLLDLIFSDLEYQQKAPLGFLLMCKLTVVLFGGSEMALRLFPLLCGLASLYIFRIVCGRYLQLPGVAVAVAIFAFAPPLVYHTVEIKQYSAELLASVLCLYLYLVYHKKRNFRSLMLWGVWGALIIWFSFSSIFILAGMAIGVSLYHLFRRDWKSVMRLSFPFVLWAISFGVNYLIITSKHTDSAWLIHYFKIRNGFMPFPPSSLRDFLWPIRKGVNRLIRFPLGLLWEGGSQFGLLGYFLKTPIIPILCIVSGLITFFKRDRQTLLVLLLPYVLVVGASAAELYPMYERLTVFLAPLFILIIALGSEQIIQILRSVSRRGAYVFPLLLLLAPFWATAKQMVYPELLGGYKKAYYREALLYINSQFKEGDTVYVYWNMLTPYWFYRKTHGLAFQAKEGQDFRAVSNNSPDYFARLTPELEALKKSKRVWVLYSKNRGSKIGEFEKRPAWYYKEVVGGKKLHQKFSAMGTEVSSYETPELKVSLFQMQTE
ncbi:ArnT family glycosyltransferase [Rufibacter latericius]|nr:glycosyltransferase family 39 protein [Rufibacter latericius]